MDRDGRVRLSLGAFVVAALVGLLLEVALLGPAALPLGVRSLFIAVGAAAGMWIASGEL
jgi:hypothetical protein